MLLAALALLLLFGSLGMVVSAWVASPPTGSGFWRLTIFIAVAGALTGLGLRFTGLAPAPPASALNLAALSVCGVALLIFGTRATADPEHGHPISLTVAGLAALAAIVTDPVIPAPALDGIYAIVYSVGLGSIALALGSVLLGMILAHWYLIQPSLPVAPLNRVLLLFLGTEVLKLVLLVAIVIFHWPEWSNAPGGLMRSFVLGDALFVCVRAVLGILSPLGLAWMTWKTVQIRSIQSATGILYAAIVFVLFGEVISAFLSLTSGQPF